MGTSHPTQFTNPRDPRDFAPTGPMTRTEAETYQLFLLVESGVQRVRLKAGKGADTAQGCRETDGFVMTADEAMSLQPIPHEAGPGTRCTCAYRPAG